MQRNVLSFQNSLTDKDDENSLGRFSWPISLWKIIPRFFVLCILVKNNKFGNIFSFPLLNTQIRDFYLATNFYESIFPFISAWCNQSLLNPFHSEGGNKKKAHSLAFSKRGLNSWCEIFSWLYLAIQSIPWQGYFFKRNQKRAHSGPRIRMAFFFIKTYLSFGFIYTIYYMSCHNF